MPGHFNIAAVADLTGIPAETLRTWERRYAVVTPLRTDGGQRRYSDGEVERLRLIAELVESGSRISTLAGLPTPELRQRLGLLREPAPRPHGSVRVLWIGSGCPRIEGSTPAGVRVTVQRTATSPAEVPSPTDDVDLVVVGSDDLGDAAGEAVQEIRRRTADARIVVTYTFLSGDQRAELEQPGVRMVHVPLPGAELRQHLADFFLAHSGARAIGQAPPAPPRYAPGELRRLAESAESLRCECPRHLANLVASLHAFEEYSRRCANETPEDEAVHRTLEQGTGWARQQIEDLLDLVLEHDGVDRPGA